jgi:hypothetical protein
MTEMTKSATLQTAVVDYESMRAVSLTLRRAGRAAIVGGAVLAMAGVAALLSGFFGHSWDDSARQLLGIVVLLSGLAAIGLGILMSAAGESVLALREIALNSRKEPSNP